MSSEQDKSPDRPSFTTFIKKGKEALGGKKTLTFVQPQVGVGKGAAGGESAQDASPNQKPLDKTQLRRAQVRSAQIKHRQRKAEYAKALENEIEGLRNKIEATQNETRHLLKENQALNARVRRSLPALSSGPNTALDGPLFNTSAGVEPSIEDVITMTLGFDDILDSPCLYISSSPSASQLGSTTTMGTTPEAPPIPQLPDMTPLQTQEAINFILALEHICRNHHHRSSPFSSSMSPSNHTLMASSIALRTAPKSVFTAIHKTTLFGTNLMTFKPPNPDSDDAVSWQASGLTLQNLYGLACTLQSDNDIEIRPVQVWFELVSRFGASVVLRVIDELKQSLGSVVKCPHYGTVLDRDTFEGVIKEVFGNY